MTWTNLISVHGRASATILVSFKRLLRLTNKIVFCIVIKRDRLNWFNGVVHEFASLLFQVIYGRNVPISILESWLGCNRVGGGGYLLPLLWLLRGVGESKLFFVLGVHLRNGCWVETFLELGCVPRTKEQKTIDNVRCTL